MSFLPYAPARGSAWFASISGSTAIHGAVVFGILTSSVALLPEPTSPAVREPEYEITLEIIDADIIELEDIEDDRAIPEDAVALAPEDSTAELLVEAEEAALAPEDDTDLLTPDDDALEPDVEALEPELETVEPEVVAIEPEVEPLAPEPEVLPEEEAPLIEEEELALLAPEPEAIEPEALPEPEEVAIPEVLPEPVVTEQLAPTVVPDPDDLAIDDLSLVDDTVFNPLAEAVAPAAPDEAPLAPDVVVPNVIDPEPTIVEEDIAAVVLPEPETVLPEPQIIAPETEAALPVPEDVTPEPEVIAPEPEAETPEPAVVAPDPESSTETATAPRPTPLANPSPAALQIGTLLQRIRATPAPQCTLALPRRAGADGVGISFIGATLSDLDTLATRILDGLDSTPAQTREILDPRQCAALDAVRLSSTYPASRIGLAVEDTTLNSGDSLRARVLGAAGLFLTLVVIDDNGVVQDLARFTTLDGNDPLIDAPVARSGPARDTRQVLVVLGSPDAPIDLSGGIGRLAQDAFASLPTDVLENAVFGLATFDVR